MASADGQDPSGEGSESGQSQQRRPTSRKPTDRQGSGPVSGRLVRPSQRMARPASGRVRGPATTMYGMTGMFEMLKLGQAELNTDVVKNAAPLDIPGTIIGFYDPTRSARWAIIGESDRPGFELARFDAATSQRGSLVAGSTNGGQRLDTRLVYSEPWGTAGYVRRWLLDHERPGLVLRFDQLVVPAAVEMIYRLFPGEGRENAERSLEGMLDANPHVRQFFEEVDYQSVRPTEFTFSGDELGLSLSEILSGYRDRGDASAYAYPTEEEYNRYRDQVVAEFRDRVEGMNRALKKLEKGLGRAREQLRECSGEEKPKEFAGVVGRVAKLSYATYALTGWIVQNESWIRKAERPLVDGVRAANHVAYALVNYLGTGGDEGHGHWRMRMEKFFGGLDVVRSQVPGLGRAYPAQFNDLFR